MAQWRDYLTHYYYFWSETVSKAKLLKRNFIYSETTEAKRFFSETKRNEAKLFLWFRETEAKRSETVSVSLSFASKRNFFYKRNWDTLIGTIPRPMNSLSK